MASEQTSKDYEVIGYREAEHRRRCALAFESEDGRTMENIPQGVVWRLHDCLMAVHSALDGRVHSNPALSALHDAGQLLDSLHIKPGKEGET